MGTTPSPEAVLAAYPQSVIKHKARQLARQRGFIRAEEDDLRQELTARLIAELHRFDPERASLNTFVARVIESAAGMMARERGRLKRGAGVRPVSLDAEIPSDDEPGSMLCGRLTPLDAARRLGLIPTEGTPVNQVAAAVSSLPDDLQAVCRELIDGNVSSAARSLGLSRRKMREAIERIRRHFELTGVDGP